MNFNEFCKFLNVTRDERRKLVQFLATLRHAETMKLAEPPPESSTTASGVEACDFPYCAVHHICTRNCEKNTADGVQEVPRGQ